MEGDNRLGEFLRARRSLMRPEDVGLPVAGRRVQGLRREELAMLAGVSVDHYARLEQGRDRHPSGQVLDALARALELSDATAAHLHELARPRFQRRRPGTRVERVRPELVRVMGSWTQTPAFVLGRRMDVLAHNQLAGLVFTNFAHEPNMVRFVFLDPGSREIYPEWDAVAADTAATLRSSLGADLDDPLLTELVGELSLKSDDFRRLWARHDGRERARGTLRAIHPLVGELTLEYEAFADKAAPGQTLVVHHASPGSASERALTLLQGLGVADDLEVSGRVPAATPVPPVAPRFVEPARRGTVGR
jgi:transcriptional regulator with XRE-family HTH domain